MDTFIRDGYSELDELDEIEEELIGHIDTDDELIEGHRQLFVASVDEQEVSRVQQAVDEHAGLKALLDRTSRMAQLLGDKDGMIADFCRDIAAELVLLTLELRKDPSALVLASLGSKNDVDQVAAIDSLIEKLTNRRNAITLEVN